MKEILAKLSGRRRLIMIFTAVFFVLAAFITAAAAGVFSISPKAVEPEADVFFEAEEVKAPEAALETVSEVAPTDNADQSMDCLVESAIAELFTIMPGIIEGTIFLGKTFPELFESGEVQGYFRFGDGNEMAEGVDFNLAFTGGFWEEGSVCVAVSKNIYTYYSKTTTSDIQNFLSKAPDLAIEAVKQVFQSAAPDSGCNITAVQKDYYLEFIISLDGYEDYLPNDYSYSLDFGYDYNDPTLRDPGVWELLEPYAAMIGVQTDEFAAIFPELGKATPGNYDDTVIIDEASGIEFSFTDLYTSEDYLPWCWCIELPPHIAAEVFMAKGSILDNLQNSGISYSLYPIDDYNCLYCCCVAFYDATYAFFLDQDGAVAINAPLRIGWTPCC